MEIMGKVIGYIECDSCSRYTQIDNPEQVTIWYHPDGKPIASVECTSCGDTVESKIGMDHMRNFKKHGCRISDLSDKFEPLTEEMIDNWDIDAELKQLQIGIL